MHAVRSITLLVACLPLLAVSIARGEERAVLELFTSQGCSSCPPADRLLRELAESPEWRDRIVPLSFHVDYWNYIGWTDPFSDAAWSKRQRDYARSLGSNRVYTPQMVVDGREDCVGSKRSCVERALRQALERRDRWEVRLEVLPEGEALRLRATATPRDGVSEQAELLVAVAERGLETAVRSGENARKTLRHDFVVRRLLHGPAAEPFLGVVPLEADWDPARLRIAAWVQDSATGRIEGAALVTP